MLYYIKMNIIIPLGGMGERFSNEGYTKPKPLIPILGKSMIQHVIDKLCLNKDDKLIVIYNNCLNKFNFNNIIRHHYDNVILIELHTQTEGAVQTLLYGLNYLDKHKLASLDNKCVILDGDTIYNVDILDIFRYQQYKNRGKYNY